MIKLSVNLNKIALIRNSREGEYPSVTAHARTCLEAGAHGITVHPRSDQRHIRPHDVFELAGLVENRDDVEFNVEGNPFTRPLGTYPGFMPLVLETKPDQATLVPDNADQLTSDHGFDLSRSDGELAPILARLKDKGIRVSLFMDPDRDQIRLARELGADRIELYTGPYADAWAAGDRDRLDRLYDQYYQAAAFATEIGLGVNAGHDLNLSNLVRFRDLPGLLEVSIGHAFTVDSLAMGMKNAVAAYLAVLQGHGC